VDGMDGSCVSNMDVSLNYGGQFLKHSLGKNKLGGNIFLPEFL
jgi:hypothetical protein